MIDIDISDPQIDPEELFCLFAYDRLLWWSPSNLVIVWGLMELWSWSLGPPTPFSKDPTQSMLEEEDLKIFMCLANVNSIPIHLGDVVILAEAWVAAGFVSKENDTFIISNEGRKILELYRPKYTDLVGELPKIRF